MAWRCRRTAGSRNARGWSLDWCKAGRDLVYPNAKRPEALLNAPGLSGFDRATSQAAAGSSRMRPRVAHPWSRLGRPAGPAERRSARRFRWIRSLRSALHPATSWPRRPEGCSPAPAHFARHWGLAASASRRFGPGRSRQQAGWRQRRSERFTQDDDPLICTRHKASLLLYRYEMPRADAYNRLNPEWFARVRLRCKKRMEL